MSKAGPAIEVVKREDKEKRLKAFIESAIVSVDNDGQPVRVLTGTLIARSAESPVVRALAAIGREYPDVVCSLRTALLIVDAQPTGDAVNLRTFAPDLRSISDQRLLNAHEQLVLGPQTAWIGDCMRREPDKRDAFECYSTECQRTSAWASTAFERLWQVAKPLRASRSSTPLGAAIEVTASEDQPASAEAAAQLEAKVVTSILTRH